MLYFMMTLPWSCHDHTMAIMNHYDHAMSKHDRHVWLWLSTRDTLQMFQLFTWNVSLCKIIRLVNCLISVQWVSFLYWRLGNVFMYIGITCRTEPMSFKSFSHYVKQTNTPGWVSKESEQVGCMLSKKNAYHHFQAARLKTWAEGFVYISFCSGLYIMFIFVIILAPQLYCTPKLSERKKLAWWNSIENFLGKLDRLEIFRGLFSRKSNWILNVLWGEVEIETVNWRKSNSEKPFQKNWCIDWEYEKLLLCHQK